MTAVANAAELKWDPYENQADINGFVIYSQEVGTDDMRSVRLDDPAATNFPLNPLFYAPGKTYRFYISAYNGIRESDRTQADRDWTPPVYEPIEKPPDIVIAIPGPVGNVRVTIGQP